MGCDIHAFVERGRTNANGDEYWIPVATFDLPRNYVAFGTMAKGVRFDAKMSFEPKGLPERMGHQASGEWERGKGDWHTPSWLTYGEYSVVVLSAELDSMTGGLEPEYYAMLHAMMAMSKKGYRDDQLRVVFWFDN